MTMLKNQPNNGQVIEKEGFLKKAHSSPWIPSKTELSPVIIIIRTVINQSINQCISGFYIIIMILYHHHDCHHKCQHDLDDPDMVMISNHLSRFACRSFKEPPATAAREYM